MKATDFLDKHRPKMLELTKEPEVTRLLGNKPLAVWLERLHRDFESVEDKPGKRPSLPGEDVFWWCVTILEELTETTQRGTHRDPYVLMMVDQFRGMHTRLADNADLPPEFQIHWFDDTDQTDDELMDAMAGGE